MQHKDKADSVSLVEPWGNLQGTLGLWDNSDEGQSDDYLCQKKRRCLEKYEAAFIVL